MIRTILITPLIASLAAYMGAMIAMHQFDLAHAVIIIPHKDGAYIAHDVDQERALKNVKNKTRR